MKAVTRNFNKKVLITNKAPTGTYSVFVTFMITKNGTISHVKPKTHFGYGIEDEIIRAIKKCPKWEPATSCGKKKNTYLEQVITIVVP
jgi:protein TonB